jgi:hypothetical protein
MHPGARRAVDLEAIEQGIYDYRGTENQRGVRRDKRQVQ